MCFEHVNVFPTPITVRRTVLAVNLDVTKTVTKLPDNVLEIGIQTKNSANTGVSAVILTDDLSECNALPCPGRRMLRLRNPHAAHNDSAVIQPSLITLEDGSNPILKRI